MNSASCTNVDGSSLRIFLNCFITQTVYTKCTNISYKIVPATNLTSYVLTNKWKRIV